MKYYIHNVISIIFESVHIYVLHMQDGTGR